MSISSLTTDRTRGINYLVFYQRASLLPSNTALVKYLDDKYGASAIDSIGKLGKGIPQDTLKKPLEKLAKSKGMEYPSMAELRSALFEAGATGASAGQILSSAVADTAKQFGSFTLFGLGTVAVIALVGGGIYLFGTSQGKKWLGSLTSARR